MTILQFRSNSIYTARLREILSDETFQLALMTLRDSNTPLESSDEDAEPEVASVRRLSRVAGFNNAIATLLDMGQPTTPPPQEEEPTYEPETP